MLNNVVSVLVFYEVFAALDYSPRESFSLLAVGILQAVLDYHAALHVVAHRHACFADFGDDELLVGEGEALEAVINNVVAVLVGRHANNVLTHLFANVSCPLFVQRDRLDQLLTCSRAMSV